MSAALKAIQRLVRWAQDSAAAINRPQAAPYLYNAAKALKVDPAADPAAAQRLVLSADQGFDQLAWRYSVNPARDEEHLLKMLNQRNRLGGENFAYHVDLTPGAPAAMMRANNLKARGVELRPLALRTGKAASVTDAQANDLGYLRRLLGEGVTTARYTPTQGEMAVRRRDPGADPAYQSAAAYDLFARFERGAPGQLQPAAAVLDPSAVRDLATAMFKNPKDVGLKKARGGLAQVKECSCNAR